MLHSDTTDRRQTRRYLVVGTAVIQTSKGKHEGELVNLGSGGLLAFCDDLLLLGERVEVRFRVQDYPLEVAIKGRIVHTAVGLIGVGFTEEPEALDEVLLWLEAGFLACLI